MCQDNDACSRIRRTGKNPNMQHIGRTHRISVAWLHDQLVNHGVLMHRTDSELQAADIFTKGTEAEHHVPLCDKLMGW